MIVCWGWDRAPRWQQKDYQRYNSGVECLSNLRSISSTFSRDNCSTLQLWGQKFKISLNYHSVCLDRWALVHSKPLRGQSVSLPWDAILPTPKVDRVRLTSSSQHLPVLPAKSGSHIWLFPELVKPLAWVCVPKMASMHPLRRNLQTNHCLHYFSCHSNKIPEGNNLIERGFVWLTVCPGSEAMVVGVAPFSRNVVW